MRDTINRLAVIAAATLAPLAFVTLVSPGMSQATECGDGTVYDPDSDTCFAEDTEDTDPPPSAPDLTPLENLNPLSNFSINACLPTVITICTAL